MQIDLLVYPTLRWATLESTETSGEHRGRQAPGRHGDRQVPDAALGTPEKHGDRQVPDAPLGTPVKHGDLWRAQRQAGPWKAQGQAGTHSDTGWRLWRILLARLTQTTQTAQPDDPAGTCDLRGHPSNA